MSDTIPTRTQADEVIEHEFPFDDLDAMCIGAELTRTIAEALGMEHDYEISGVIYADDDEDYWLGEASKALAMLIEKGYVRRSDFVYVEESEPHVRRVD